MNRLQLSLLNAKHQENLVKVTPDTSVTEVICLMNQTPSSCVLILREEKLLGIFTKTDVVRSLARQVVLADQTIAELMSQPVITVSETEAKDLATVLQKFQQYGISHLPVINEQEQLLDVVTPLTILSKHQQTEAALRESEERWQLAIAGTDEAIWDWNIATNQTFRSDRWFELLGYDRHELSNCDDEWSHRIHPDDYERVMAAQTAYLQRQADIYSVEYRLRRKNGSYGWFRSRAKAVWDESGNPIRLVGSLGDISQSKATELALHEREAMLRKIGDHLPNGAIYQIVRELDGSDRFCYMSAGIEKLMEIKAKDVLKDYSLLYRQVIAEDIPHLADAVNESIQHLSVFNIQIRICTPSGQIKWVQLRSTPHRCSDGRTAWDGLVVDITERKQAELEIIHSRHLREAIFNESADALFLVDPKTLLTTDCNQQAVKMFGASHKAELIGIEGQTLQKQRFTPEELAACVAQINRQGFWSQEVEYLTKQGKLFWGNLAIKRIRVAGQDINLARVTDISEQIAVLRDRQLAEAALAQSEEQLRLTFEFTNIGTWDWNVQTGAVIWNDNHYRLLGLNPATSTAHYQSWRNTVHPEDINRVEQAISSALQHRTNYEAEYRVIHPDGSIHWLTGKGRGIYNQTEQPIRMLGVMIDTDDHKRTEQALLEKEQFLRSIYDGVGQSIFVVDVINDDFRYVGLNHTHEILTGFVSNDIKGKTPEQILPADAAAMVRQHYQDCVDTGKTISYEECLPFQGQLTWWISSLTPLRDENSNIYRIVGNSVNISDRKHTEQILELQAIIARNMAEGICLVRASDGVIVYTNPKFEQMFGYDSGELIGHHISIVNYAHNQVAARAVHKAIAASLTQKVEVTYEVHNVKKDGTPFWCSATTCVFEHPEYGAVFVAVQQDITAQKQAAENIQASLKEKEVLLKEIHHRVKNNLGIVSSLLQMQCRRTQDSQATAILRDSQNRIASIALVHEKLYRSDDLANINFAQYIPDLTTHLFDSYNVSSHQIRLNIQVENVNLDIETAIPCGLIINELVSNALKYAFPVNRVGEIKVSLSQTTNQTLTLIVSDNGIGLPAEFESKKSKTLGMTLIQGLVKQLGGVLEIHTHQGTQFKISFTAGRV